MEVLTTYLHIALHCNSHNVIIVQQTVLFPFLNLHYPLHDRYMLRFHLRVAGYNILGECDLLHIVVLLGNQ